MIFLSSQVSLCLFNWSLLLWFHVFTVLLNGFALSKCLIFLILYILTVQHFGQVLLVLNIFHM